MLPAAAAAHSHSGTQKLSYLEVEPQHPGLDFKRVGRKSPVYSVRVGIGWRALGLLQGNTVVWFWIGSHTQYNRLLTAI